MMKKISVIGMGSWGTTLAILLAEKGFSVFGWEWIKNRAEGMEKYRENKIFLPGCHFPDNANSKYRMKISNDLDFVVENGDIILLAVPSHIIRKICESEKNLLAGKQIVNVAKGIENGSLMRMSEVIHDATGISYENILTLSGPTHAEEVSKKLPATIVAASKSKEFAKQIQNIFMTDFFRVYTSNDLVGVELGGSTKNIIAIGAGISSGMNLGDNAAAALIARGLREITRLGIKFGANPHTFSGISGIGDLIVTCGSEHSRNRHVGVLLAKGKSLQKIIDGMEMVAEGVKTTKSVYYLSEKFGIDMPITRQIYRVLFEGLSPQQALRNLMTREGKSEEEF
ncbi:MAG: NAD(P)H-dependent glycerol-3-phosphate dehydrogenase [Candidatus Cloacimonadota bacterium]|nr:NAD(P)H-dependent glycerol-3-phosphate dehydrogenase [Candidatus Cloacimonadota bacterium]